MGAGGRRATALYAAVLVAGTVIAGVPAAAAPVRARLPQPSAHPVVTHQAVLVPAWRSGVFAGYSVRRDEAFGAWRGNPITSATDFESAASWTTLENSGRVIETWRNHQQGIQLSLAVPLWPGFGDHMAAVASGYFDDRFKKMATSLIAAGLGHSILRIGWEFNGSWFAWGITHTQRQMPPSPARARIRANRAREFASAWRHIVRAIRTVPGEHFTFDWCVSAGKYYPYVALAYPGNSYVDYIGDDVYDWNSWQYEQPSQRWQEIVKQGTGLRWQVRFAKAHHKPLSFPEWALVADLFSRGQSGNDDPSFVRHMYEWFAHHDVAYENYFDYDPYLGLASGMTTGNGQFKIAREVYRRLWSRLPLVRRQT